MKTEKQFCDFLQIKHKPLYYAAIFLPGIYSREIKAHIHTNTYTQMPMANCNSDVIIFGTRVLKEVIIK